MLNTQQLLRPNTLIPIVQFFPGTSGSDPDRQPADRAVDLALRRPDRRDHARRTLFAVFLLAEVHLSSARAGAVAALVYAMNPSALYFDTQYAYESVAIGLFCWVLALTQPGHQGGYRGAARIGFTVAAILCAAGCVVTHHLTTRVLADRAVHRHRRHPGRPGPGQARAHRRRSAGAPQSRRIRMPSPYPSERWVWPIVFVGHRGRRRRPGCSASPRPPSPTCRPTSAARWSSC